MSVSDAIAKIYAHEVEEGEGSPFTRLVHEAAGRTGRVFHRGDGTLILRDDAGRTLFQCIAVADPTPQQAADGVFPVEAAEPQWFN